MLLAALTSLFMGLGYILGGPAGAAVALVAAAGMNLFTFWNADRILLSMHDAHEVDARACPALHGIVARANGTIAVDAEPIRGTTLTVRFPSAAALTKAA